MRHHRVAKKFGRSTAHRKALMKSLVTNLILADSIQTTLPKAKQARKDADERERLRKLLNMSMNEIELSVRAANCLNNANITTVGELAQKTEADMLKYRNFGKKSLNEIKDKLKDLGLCLGYKFDADLLESKK